MKHLSRGDEGVFFYNKPGVWSSRIFKTNLSSNNDLRVNKKHVKDRLSHGIKPRTSNVSSINANNESNIKLYLILLRA